MSSSKKRRRLSQQDLQAAGATPGFITTRYSPDGRAEIRQLAPETPERRKDFVRRLTDETKASEGG
jgi:hypothetical protein